MTAYIKYYLYNVRKMVPLLCALIGFFLMSTPFSAHAGIYGMPMPDAPCPNGSVDVASNGVCKPNKPGSIIGARSIWSGKESTSQYMYSGFDVYVPVDGLWSVVAHICDANSGASCTLSNSIATVRSSKSVKLVSNKTVNAQNPDFGGGAGPTMPNAIRICYTFVTPDGHEWAASADRTCQDARMLPEEPQICAINSGNNLDVSLGTLESDKISTVPNSSDAVKKSISIQCQGNASLNGKITFKFTPITISGNSVILSTNPGIGVALFYQDKLVKPDTAFDLTVPNGGANINLGFQGIKDDTKSLTGGDFSADAVMIITQQ